ncbi:MAG: DEAD/DEAH box helicase [Paracoccaceae bacterium]|nr:DEAD/DEAH box helicase [Paracoccaceae bacterium]MDO7733542.1 DEAD/DEAH box helicase [Paracoccaceae bacterium]
MIKFSDLALDPRVLTAIAEAGYETPTPIQAQAIPFALEGRDVLGIAQTGTGKTASFTLPLITMLGKGRARARMPRSLVLAPTRELAAQVAENFDTYAKHTKLTKALLIGGVSFGEQDKLIDRGVDVLIATPGRLLDHFERGKLLLTGVQIMVVDEADRMLDMGFIPDIERIFQMTPFTRQTLFFSATMAPEIERITNTFLSNPAKIEVARQSTTSTTIEQALIELHPARKDRSFADKRMALRALIKQEGEACTNAIIFCNRKMDVDVVAKSLKQHGMNASPIHGDLDQSVRTRTLESFRDGTLHLLVASDVAARGLDIPAVSHVFNFDVPSHPEDYVHRIGRTGRAGRKGKAYTLSLPSDEKYLLAIEALIKSSIPRGALPEGFEPSATGPLKPATKSDDKPKAERTVRAPRNRNERGNKTTTTTMQDTAADQISVDQTAPTADVKPEVQTAADTRNLDAREPRNRNNRDTPWNSRLEEPRQAREQYHHKDRYDNGPVVVGLGDHVPDFIMRSFKITIAPQSTETKEEDKSEVA